MTKMIEEVKNGPVEQIGWFKKFIKSFWGEVLQIVVISLIIVIPFRIYIAQPFLVSGPSMDDTFAKMLEDMTVQAFVFQKQANRDKVEGE